MEPIRVYGKIVTQPVVITSAREITILLLIETVNGYEDLYFSAPILSQKIGAQIIRRQASYIALSSVGDYVELDVSKNPKFSIINFKNITRNLGHVLPNR